MNKKAEELVRLAEVRFGGLTTAEWRMLRAAATNDVADCRDLGGGDNRADNEHWPHARTVRAELVRWVCVDREALARVDSKGINVWGAKVLRKIDLAFAQVPFMLSLQESVVKGGLHMYGVRVPVLWLDGTQSGPINLDQAEIGGSVFLRKVFITKEGVRLVGAKVGGNLDCAGGIFKNPRKNALVADRANIGGDILLTAGFEADGQVRLVGARIGVNLNCTRGTFKTRKGGVALSAERAKIGGSVYLRKGFIARGEVQLIGATVGSNLECLNGTFRNPEADAFCAERIEVGGNVLFGPWPTSSGRVALGGAKIDGNVRLSAHSATVDRVELRGARIGGVLAWSPPTPRVDATLDLRHAKAGQFQMRIVQSKGKGAPPEDNENGWPKKGKLLLDGFTYDAIVIGLADAQPYLEWLRRQPEKPYSPQPYTQLAKVLREAGHDEDARKVLIAREEDRRAYGGMSRQAKAGSYLLWLFIGHGYRPFRALAWAASLVVLGLLIFSIASWTGHMVPGSPSVLLSTDYRYWGDIPENYPKLNTFLYSVDTFFPIVDLHQEKYWLPTGWFYRGYLWTHIVFGWSLTSLFVAGFTRLVRKEH